MNRRGSIRPGCLIWGALILLVVTGAWKSIDFFLLRPAGVKAALNDAYDSVRGFRGTIVEKRSTCRESWEEIVSTTENPYVLRCHGPAGQDLSFTDDSVYVQYPDTLHFPIFGEIPRVFKIARPF
jgi:hypothetical protein